MYVTATQPFSFRWLAATYGEQLGLLPDLDTDLVSGASGTLVTMFRKLVVEDLPTIWEINRANVPAVGEESPESLAEIMRMAEVALGVTEAETLVGFCLVLPPNTSYDSPNYRYFCERFDDFAYLDRVAFAPLHRGKGLGSALYGEVTRRLDRPRLTLEVNVVPPNEGSMRFHLRHGFVELEQRETRPGKVVSLMSRDLEQHVAVP